MKILCVCNGGNCRSVALAEVLKGIYGHEATAIGTYWFSHDSQRALAEWAEAIYFVEEYDAKLPEPDKTKWMSSPLWGKEYETKRRLIPIGPDIWGHSNWDAIKRAANDALKSVPIL